MARHAFDVAVRRRAEGNVKQSQRRFHANIWPVIAIVMLATLAVAVVVREHPAPPTVEAR